MYPNENGIFKQPNINRTPIDSIPEGISISNREGVKCFEIELNQNIVSGIKTYIKLENIKKKVWLSIWSKEGSAVRHKIDKGYINVNVELDDIISRYMSKTYHNDETFNKMVEEINDKFDLDFVSSDLQEDEIEITEKIGYLYNIDNLWEFTCGSFTFVEYSNEMNTLVNFYKLDLVDVIDITLAYRNYHNKSGSNWSPIEIGNIVKHFKGKCKNRKCKNSHKFSVIESFSSPFNNQNFLYKRLDLVDAAFTLYETDKKIPFVKGTFPKSLIPTIESIEGNILLLVNPVFAEDIITLSIDEVFKLYRDNISNARSRIITVMAIPNWDDLYSQPNNSKKLTLLKKNIGIDKHFINGTTVRNHHVHQRIGLKYYLWIINPITSYHF